MSTYYLPEWSPLRRVVFCTGLIVLLSACLPPAWARDSRAPARIGRVRVEGRGKNATLRVGLAGNCRVVRTRLNDPERLVLDFTPARWSGDPRAFAGGGPVRGVRVAQHPGNRVRVVVDTGTRVTRWSGQYVGGQWVGHGRAVGIARSGGSRRSQSARAPGRSSLRGLVIGIDPGHGGSDPGAISRCGLMEKKVTLRIAQQLRRLLRSQGARVLMTRADDRRLPEESRIAFVSQGKLDLLVSIHCDALEGPRNCTGITTYYRTGRRRGQQLAEALQKRLPAITGLPNRGAREDTSLYPKKGLYVLRNAACPAVLVETGYISCAATATRLRDAGFRLRVARGIVQGLQHYVSNRPARTARR